jgi:tripartite-type tricarboxylate transporter receptor subunit TctC
MSRHSMLRRKLIAAATLAAALPAFAQSSGQPIRVILPVGAGSGVDAITRAMSPAVSQALGQPLVIENQPGAGGITGTAALAKAAPDGRTFGMVSNNHVVFPSVNANVPFDPIADFTPVMVVGALSFVLLAHPSVPAKDVRELVALAKAKPGSLNYGSSGNGTILHLAGEMLLSEAGIDIKHIPYKSAGQLIADLIGGQIQLGFFAVSVAASHVKSGALKALGVSTAARSPLLPEVPTIAEQGYPNYALEGWFAVLGPAKLPPTEVARLNAAFKTALATPEVQGYLAKQGYTVYATTPEAAGAFFRSELAKHAKLVKQAGVKID